jgi:hypothetical protein
MTGPVSKDIIAAVETTLTKADIPVDRGFVTILDQHGARVALATKTKDGWSVNLNGGYNWDGVDQGGDIQLRIGKHW